MIELLGWVANILFAIIGIPDVYKSYSNKKRPTITWMFLIMWLVAQVAAAIYLIIKDLSSGETHYPMYFSYTVGGLSAISLIIAKIKFK